MLSVEKRKLVEEAQRKPITSLRTLSGQLAWIKPDDLGKIKMFEKVGDDVWQLNIDYNGLTIRYALAFENGDWYSTMSTPRLTALLSYYIDNKIDVPYIDLTIYPSERKQSRKFVDIMVGLLYNIPYPIRFQYDFVVYSITATERAIVVDVPKGRQVIPIEGDTAESVYDLKELCEAVLKYVPDRFYVCNRTRALPEKDTRFAPFKHIGDMSIYHLGDACVIYKPDDFLISNVDLNKLMPGSGKELVELLDLYCALNNDVEFSVNIANILVKLNVEEDAIKLLKKLTDTTGKLQC